MRTKTKLEKINYINWKEQMWRCPSQCFCYFEADGEQYCIYLRWRGGDPWDAHLLPLKMEQDINYYLHWEWLDVKDYTHDNYTKLEEECIALIKERFGNVQWMQEVEKCV